MLFTSLRSYPITLTAPNGQPIVIYPGQKIDLPEEVGMKFSGLLHPAPHETIVKLEPKVDKRFTAKVEVEEVVEEEDVSDILVETMKIANERKTEKKLEAKKLEDPTPEPIKKKAGRPKKT